MGGWHAHPDAAVPEPAPGPVKPGRVVGLGAICDPLPPGDRSLSFAVSEFISLADGRRVILHRERGFTVSGTGDTGDSIVRDVLNSVLPDRDEAGEDHPYPWLAELARARGLEVTADDLRALPYEVVLTDPLGGSAG